MSAVTWTAVAVNTDFISIPGVHGLFLSCELQDFAWTRNCFMHRKREGALVVAAIELFRIAYTELGLFYTTQLVLVLT